MFGTIRRHQNWLWAIIITVIIISFVVFFSPDASLPGRADQPDVGSINGRPILLEDYRSALNETQLGYFFRSGGEWPGSDQNTQRSVERDTIFRVFLLQKLDELGIEVSDKAAARVARERIGDFPLATFEKERLQPKGLKAEDFMRFVQHEAAIQELAGVAAISAKLLDPREAEIIYRREHEDFNVDLAVFSASNYLDNVALTPAAVGQFYTNRMANYRVPERIQVSYVEFAATNFLGEADRRLNEITNLNARIDEAYLKLGADYFKDTNGVVLSEAAAKQKVRQDERERLALLEARKKASELGTKLVDLPQPHSADTLEKLAATNGLSVKVSPPLDRMGVLESSDLPPAFRQKAFALTKEEPVSYSPIPGDRAVYLIALKDRFPSELPPLEKIQDKVSADYKNTQAIDLAKKAGASFHTNLTNGLALKKSFSELCAEAKAKTVSLPPFSASTKSLPGLDEKLNLRMIQSTTLDMQTGQASDLLPTPDGGIIVYFRARLPFDETKVKKELPEYLAALRQYRQNDAFNRWFQKQAEQARLALPKKEAEEPKSGTPPAAAN